MPLEPMGWRRATLVDLLDRLLDKGLVLKADVIISVAGIPLIGVNLTAAIAGIETMLEYGMMNEWDEQTRAQVRKEIAAKPNSPLAAGEKLVLRMFGSHHHCDGIYHAWRPGFIYLSDTRLALWHEMFARVLLEVPLERVTSLAVGCEPIAEGKQRDTLYLLTEDGRLSRLRGEDVRQLHDRLADRLRAMGRVPQAAAALAAARVDNRPRFLAEGEEVTHSGKMWFEVTEPTRRAGGPLDWFLDNSDSMCTPMSGKGVWKRGLLCLTDRRLCWSSEFEDRLGFEVSLEQIASCAAEMRDLSQLHRQKRVIDVVYRTGGTKRVVSFSGADAPKWEQALKGVLCQADAHCPPKAKTPPAEVEVAAVHKPHAFKGQATSAARPEKARAERN